MRSTFGPAAGDHGLSRAALRAALILSLLPASTPEARDIARAADEKPKIEHVFFAQQHVQAPDSPHFKLVGNLETLVKIHVDGKKDTRAPEARIMLSLGSKTLELPLKGPGLLPAPVAGNPILMEHKFEDSYTASIPREWVRTGLKVAVELRERRESGNSSLVDQKVYNPLPVGAPTRLIMTMFDFHFFGGAKGADYPQGWFEELGAKLPVAELELRRVRNILLDKLVMPPQYDGPAVLCGSREEYQKKTGHGFDGEQSIAGLWNGALKEAAGAGWGGVRRLYYSNIYGVHSGGQAGGLSGRGNGTSTGILLHELGHAFGLPHWAGNAKYPYVGPMHGITAEPETPHVGPVWAFDPVRRVFLSPLHGGSFKHDPMQGGGSNRSGGPYSMTPFSDYSVSRIRECLETTQVVWDPQAGRYNVWNQKDGAYSTTARSRGGPHCPVEDDIDVISVLACASLVTPEANIVYPPIGPYRAGRLESEKGSSTLCLRVTQGGNTKIHPVKADLQPGGDPKDPKTFSAFAINLPARDGEVTQADLIQTAGGKVLYSWKAASAPGYRTETVTALYPAGSPASIAGANRPPNGNPPPKPGPPPPEAESASGARKPPAPIRPADAATIAAWDAKLLARIREDLKEGRKPRFRWTTMGDWADIVGIGPKDEVRILGKDGEASVAWPSIPMTDRRNLSIALAREGQAEDHALAAFFLLASGDPERARFYLEKAGSAADEVMASFQEPPPGRREFALGTEALARYDFGRAWIHFSKVVESGGAADLVAAAKQRVGWIAEVARKRLAEVSALEALGQKAEALEGYQQITRDFAGLPAAEEARRRAAALRR
jgi:hypothetical protein